MKEYINQMLGNNLRCILPSYWWKNILGKMADAIASAKSAASSASQTANRIQMQFDSKQNTLISGSNIKKINGNDILGSGDLVLDTWKLEKYATEEELKEQKHLDGGEIASVVDKTIVDKSFSECYQPTSSEINTNRYNTKFTKVDGITVNPDFNPDLISANYGELNVILYSDGKSKGYYKAYPTHLTIRCGYDRNISCIEWDGGSGQGNTLYRSGTSYPDVMERVNKILREGDFRFSYFEIGHRADVNSSSYSIYYSYLHELPSDAITMIDNAFKMQFAETTNADIYLKSANWEKLAKDSRVTELETRIEELEARLAALEK